MAEHQLDQVLQVELDRVQVFDVIVFQHPGEVAEVRIAGPPFLAAKHDIEYLLGQRQVFGRAVGDQPAGERCASPRLVEDAVFGDFREQVGLRVVVFGQCKGLRHEIDSYAFAMMTI